MARRTASTPSSDTADYSEKIVDIDVEEEMQGRSSSTPTR